MWRNFDSGVRPPCECGCGLPAPVIQRTWRARGLEAGGYYRFRKGHAHRIRTRWVETEAGCWEWQGSTTPSGYGQQTIFDLVTHKRVKNALVHRLNYEARHGAVPPGLELDHLCRNRLCVNPDHLEAVTHATNTRRGARSRLNDVAALAIRRLRSEGVSPSRIAAVYGVAACTVVNVAAGRNWA